MKTKDYRWVYISVSCRVIVKCQLTLRLVYLHDSCVSPRLIQDLALREIPASVLDTIKTPEHSGFSFPFDSTDVKAFNLVRWFKDGFMNWVDPIVCPECGGETVLEQDPTQPSSSVTAEEQRWGAGRVEVHRCKADSLHSAHRFPRYK